MVRVVLQEEVDRILIERVAVAAVLELVETMVGEMPLSILIMGPISTQ